MSLSSANIAAGIAALTVTGVSIKDIDEIPQQIQPRDCPILFPHPDGWMGGASAEPSTSAATFGTPSTRMWIFNRTFQYVYLHAPVGAGRGIADQYPGLAAKADAISEALTTLDVSNVDVKNVAVGTFGVLADPSGGQFYGFILTITVREKVNA